MYTYRRVLLEATNPQVISYIVDLPLRKNDVLKRGSLP